MTRRRNPSDRGCGPDGPTPKELRERLFRPAQPRRAEARAALEEVWSEGWTSVRGSSPGTWQTEPAALDALREALIGRGLLDARWARSDALPVVARWPTDTLDGALDLVELAADPEGVATAEHFALEARRRVAPWYAPNRLADRTPRERPRVRWSFVQASWPAGTIYSGFPLESSVFWLAAMTQTPGEWLVGLRKLAKAPALTAKARTHAWRSADALAMAYTLTGTTAAYAALHTLAAWHAWELLAAGNGRATTRASDLGPVAGVPPGTSLAELPNPFAPAVDIWCLGYGVAQSTRDATVLVAARHE